MELCGKVVPKGTSVLIPIIAAHRDPRNFANPDEYDLGRWLDGADQGGLTEGLDDGGSSKVGAARQGGSHQWEGGGAVTGPEWG